MLQKKLEQLDKMGINELELFREKVLNSMLSNREKGKAVELIEQRKKQIDISSAMAVESEGIDFD